ncbi:uncharacterized protein LOC120478181 [Pimephales promelas]|uniref:uncharacterized protein LOC120478181 n=1 Tax=Pimephales promelas TaxID=90988 RepID=UPI0019555523|nr:uncharacterized protein LOC120478181 [Pimephales promelas]
MKLSLDCVTYSEPGSTTQQGATEDLRAEIESIIVSLLRKKQDLYRQHDSNQTRQRKRRKIRELKNKLRQKIVLYDTVAEDTIDGELASNLTEDYILPWERSEDGHSFRLKRSVFDQTMLIRRLEEEQSILVKEMSQHITSLRKEIKADKPLDATESSEADLFRNTEQTPPRSSSFKTQDKPLDATESSEADLFRTTEQTPPRSSSFKTQCLHNPEPLPSMNKVGMNPSLVDYTDSDESQSPSPNHDQFNSSCQTWCPTSEFELSLTHQDGDSVPRLRRTKSIQMKRNVEFDSNELFDSSASSGEEYIPKSSEDSSEDTDTSEVIEPVNQKESMLRFPIQGKYADIRELNDVSSTQILSRGRSPSRREGNSGMTRKRRCSSSSRRTSYPTTQASSGHSTKWSGGETLNL